MQASRANIAPARKGASGPNISHSAPASMLAASNARPVTRLNMPKAVPRNSVGAASAISVARTPYVNPICRPHRLTPMARAISPPEKASIRLATISRVIPTISSQKRFTRSESMPTG